MELRAIANADDVIVYIEDDGDVSTTITCRCPLTGQSKSYDFMSSDFDGLRDTDTMEIQAVQFAAISEHLAHQFVSELGAE